MLSKLYKIPLFSFPSEENGNNTIFLPTGEVQITSALMLRMPTSKTSMKHKVKEKTIQTTTPNWLNF